MEKFKPGISVDIGTANIVTTRQTEDGTFVNKYHRNMLYPLDVTDESKDLLDRSNYLYIKTDDKYYVIGDDALNLVNAIGKGKIVRPMQNGLLNPDLKESSQLLLYIIKAIVGSPIVENEPIRFTCPANPIDKDADNLFHQMIITNFLNKEGFVAKPINEATCLIYDNSPIMKSEGGDVPLTGIAVSFGAGMANICLALKGLSLVEFSCTKSGDNIDEQVEKVTGIARNKIIKIKEKLLDLNNTDMSDRVQAALSIYYDETIERIVHNMGKKFKDINSEMDGEIEIIVAGGTSMPKGFINRFEAVIKKSSFPFKVYRIRHSDSPFYSVSQGACLRAMSDYQKIKK